MCTILQFQKSKISNNKMESSASIKRQIEVIYEQREVNDNNELEEEETYKEKIRLINQQIKRLLKQKKKTNKWI